jgi:heme a synthase
VTLQAALGIWTLLMVAPIGLALLHQAMAMLVLTVATVHAQQVMTWTECVAIHPSRYASASP